MSEQDADTPETEGAIDDVSRTRVASGPRQAAPTQADQDARTRSIFIWVVILVIGAGALVPLVVAAGRELAVYSLATAEDAAIAQRLEHELPDSASAAFLEGLSELHLAAGANNAERALHAARRAVEKDPGRPYAWATIAFLESREGTPPASAFEALGKSMDACPVCSQDLIQWRLNFVLTHWKAAPEDLRRRAFEHADLLRWSGDSGEFLAEMRIKAIQAGIPFDDYRAAVNTPVRSWDIGPAPDEAGN
jgi:hypothetical protein